MAKDKQLTRRQFAKLCGTAGLVLAAPAGLIPLAEAAGPNRFTETRLKMGTIVTLTAVTDSSVQAQEGFAAAFREIDRLTGIFDRHQNKTVLSEINTEGRISDPGPEILQVLALARQVYLQSDRAFDPTILPLLTLIEESFTTTGRPPQSGELNEAGQLVDFGAVEFGRWGVKLGKQGQQLSLDGVAKGYIIDRAGETMKKYGLNNVLINAGGDILALGHREKKRPWRIGIQDPFHKNKYLKIITLSNQAVATSGSYEIYFDRKKEYHHLLNPRAGRPARGLVSATTVTGRTALADALSTACFVSPELHRTVEGAEALIVDREGRRTATSGFKKYIAG